jgi:catabolite regulation protein CreA
MARASEGHDLGWNARWAAGILAVLGVAELLLHWHHVSEERYIVGSINMAFKLIGPDHKIIIECYEDRKSTTSPCLVNRRRAGSKVWSGWREDTSDASVAVRQTGPIRVKEGFENSEDAFSEKRSVLFKRLHVSRYRAAPHKRLFISRVDRPVYQWFDAEFDFGSRGVAFGDAGALSL